MSVVSNSSPLIWMARVGKLEILKTLFGKIFIPDEVYTEVVEKGLALGMPEAACIGEETGKWIEIVKIHPKQRRTNLTKSLHKGEIDAIHLAIEKSMPVLIDERPGTKMARVLGVEPIGTLRIILMAYEEDLLTIKESESLVNELVTIGFRLSAHERDRMMSLLETIKNEKKE